MPGSSPPELEVDELRRWMSEPNFNLAEEPWLEVETYSDPEHVGGSEHVGLRELYRRAHEFADLVAGTDVERWALRLFVIAVGAQLLPSGPSGQPAPDRLDVANVDRYFDECRHRLWLFHPTQPFFQQVELIERLARVEAVPSGDGARRLVPLNTIKTLSVELAAKDKHTWWDHVPDEDPTEGWYAMEPARAARLLITRALFGEAGNEMGPPGDRNSPEGLYGAAKKENAETAANRKGRGLLLVMRKGATLLETICANALEGDVGGAGLSTAELTGPDGAERPLDELTPLERALWSPKATLLIPPTPGSDGQVRWVLRAARQPPPTGTDKKHVKEARAEVRKLLRAHSSHTISRGAEKGLEFVWTDPKKDAWREMPAIAESFSGHSGARSVLSTGYLAFTTCTPVETLGCIFRGNPAGWVLDGWQTSELPPEFVASPEIVAELARHLGSDGALTRAAKALHDCGRFVTLPTYDRDGKPATPARDLPDPALVTDALAEFWADAKRLAEALVSETASESPIITPDWWPKRVADLAERSAASLFDQIDRADPGRVFHTAVARRRLRSELATLKGTSAPKDPQ